MNLQGASLDDLSSGVVSNLDMKWLTKLDNTQRTVILCDQSVWLWNWARLLVVNETTWKPTKYFAISCTSLKTPPNFICSLQIWVAGYINGNSSWIFSYLALETWMIKKQKNLHHWMLMWWSRTYWFGIGTRFRKIWTLVLEREPVFYGNARAVYTSVCESFSLLIWLKSYKRNWYTCSVSSTRWICNCSILKRPFGWPVVNFYYQPYFL